MSVKQRHAIIVFVIQTRRNISSLEISATQAVWGWVWIIQKRAPNLHHIPHVCMEKQTLETIQHNIQGANLEMDDGMKKL